MWRPDPAPQNARIGFTTYAMWGLCAVIIGACYVFEQNELSKQPAEKALPEDVRKVLPSGSWLMSARRAARECPPSLVVRRPPASDLTC